MDAEAAAPSTTTYIPPKIPPPEHRLSALGLLRTMVRNPMAAVPRAAYEQPVVRTRVGGRDIMFITGPEIVERILLREHEAFPKSHVDERIFKPIFGTGLLTAEGEDWRWKRRLAAPAFRQKALSAYLPAMRMPFEDLASRWAQAPGPHRVNEATPQPRWMSFSMRSSPGSISWTEEGWQPRSPATSLPSHGRSHTERLAYHSSCHTRARSKWLEPLPTHAGW